MNTDGQTLSLNRVGSIRQCRALMQTVVSLGMAFTLSAQAGSPTDSRPGKRVDTPNGVQVQTATTHPMKYFISLPKDWASDRKWPVLVAPSAHYDAKGKTIQLFETERDARNSHFIIVAPFVINADRVTEMQEYRGTVMDSIIAADAATADGGRDEDARAKFDSEGVVAVIKDVQKLYRGDDRVYVAGFSSSTHIAYLFLFTHPELLKGVFINSGVYLGRGVDDDHIPFKNSPERAGLNIKFMIGEKDPGYQHCVENWQETKAQLLSYGHPASKIQMEVIKPGNPEHLSAGHNWFPTKIFAFCTAAELALQK